MTRWIEETFHPHWRVRLAAERILHEVKTAHQHLVIFTNATWGTVLMLDGVCQLTTRDEFIYHEMMAHVPLMALARPRRVLVIGGGDGGVLREVLKHPSVEKATLCEIDRAVIDLSLKHYPKIAGGAFDDARAEVVIADGLKYVAQTGERFDANYICGSAGNAALMAFTRALGGRSMADNIRVVGINPGPVGTDRHVTLLKTRAKNQFGDENRYKEFQKGMPLGRPAHAREIGDLMAFLASDRSGYTSGVIFTVDGGYTSGWS